MYIPVCHTNGRSIIITIGVNRLVGVRPKGGKVAVLVFVVIQPNVHGSDIDHLSLVSTFMNELLVPQ